MNDTHKHLTNYTVSSAKDIYAKLQHFSNEDKAEVVKEIIAYMRETRTGRPMIRIHNSEVISLVNENTLASRLVMHYADVFIIDFPSEHYYDEVFLKKIIDIFLPRLRERGLLILKDTEGIRVLKKNVSYGLKPQLLGVDSK